MSTVIRFHLDENMPNPVAYGLRARGRDATISNDIGLIGASDEEQLFFALQNQRALLTRDDDLVKMAASGSVHAGIIYWTQKRHYGLLVRELDALCIKSSAAEMVGVVKLL